MGNQPRFTDDEKRIIRESTHKEACRLLPDRTPGCITTQRYKMNHPDRFKGTGIPWTAQERKILLQHYETSTRDEMLKLLPGRCDEIIRRKASRAGLRKRFCGATTNQVFSNHGQELVDQIRMRAKADGITMRGLDKALGTRHYFSYNWNRGQKRINIVRVLKAIDFFGGKLAIDWNDR